MAETIDEARIIAWIDGELPAHEAASVAARVSQDAALAALAEKHRMLKRRFAAAFGPLAGEELERPPAPSADIISLAERRAAREKADADGDAPAPPARRWNLGWPGAVAASLLIGLFLGHQGFMPAKLGDRPDALALDPKLSGALDRQLSGDAGPIRITLSFRDKQGAYCRSFAGSNLSGVACRDGDGWALRYGAGGAAPTGSYRMAGGDGRTMVVIGSMIDGDPLDRAQEGAARMSGWR